MHSGAGRTMMSADQVASDVFMMDTWWNEAIEQQAIDRVHRLGQTKPVYVTRYVIKGTVGKFLSDHLMVQRAFAHQCLLPEKRILKIRE